MRAQRFILAFVVGLLACGADSSPSIQASRAISSDAMRDYCVCDNRPFSPSPDGWDHKHHRLNAKIMSTRYIAQDVIMAPGENAMLSSGFYFHGTGGHGISDERVQTFVDDCNGWLLVGGGRTDEAGEVHVRVPDTFLRPGQYGVRHELKGDGTTSDSDLYILPRGTQLVVLDMDGTLTVSNLEIWRKVYEDLHKRKYVPKPITGARDVVSAWAKKGFVPVYLTARPTWLAPSTREWRTSFEFPEGPIVFASRASDIIPSHSEKYKIAYLKGLVDAGFKLAYAYGNADSDANAYRQVGVADDHVFIIGKGQFGGYEEHVAWVDAQADAAQPLL